MLIDGMISTSRWMKLVDKICAEQGQYMLIVCTLMFSVERLLMTP
jgi:hypothetical protein